MSVEMVLDDTGEPECLVPSQVCRCVRCGFDHQTDPLSAGARFSDCSDELPSFESIQERLQQFERQGVLRGDQK